MMHETACGRRAICEFARELYSLSKRGATLGGRARTLRAAIAPLLSTWTRPKGAAEGEIGPWYYMPGKKTRPTPNWAVAIRAWAKVEA